MIQINKCVTILFQRNVQKCKFIVFNIYAYVLRIEGFVLERVIQCFVLMKTVDGREI